MTFDASGAQQFPIPTDGAKYPCFAPWGECMSYTVQNRTDQDVFITDQAGRQFTVPAGATETTNHTFYILTVQTKAATTVGALAVALYREARDIGTSYAAVSINNPITITGAVAITGAVTISGPVVMTNVTIETNTGNTTNNLQALLNSIGSTRITSPTLDNNAFTTNAMVVPIGRFIVQVIGVGRPGLLRIMTIGPGVNNNVVQDGVYIADVPQIPYEFEEIVPVGFNIYLFFTGNGTFSVSY